MSDLRSSPALPVPPAAAPAGEIERRVQWRALALVAFLGLMLGLAVVAVWSLFSSERALDGLPADPDVRAARDLVRDRVPVDHGSLRFTSEFMGESAPGRVLASADLPLLARAESLLTLARARHRNDPRIVTALAHLELARRHYARAEQSYRRAVDMGAHSPEARLGLGVTLAREAEVEPDPLRARALELQAIAQFAAVRDGDACRLAARYDRALMCARVGRMEEARHWAGTYLAEDDTSSWARTLRATLAP